MHSHRATRVVSSTTTLMTMTSTRGRSPYDIKTDAPAVDTKKSSAVADRLRATEEALRAAKSLIAEQEQRERELKKLLVGSGVEPTASPSQRPMSISTTTYDAHDSQLDALKTVHDAKVRALMKSIHQLQEQIQTLKAQDKEHRRSALIQNLRKSQREQELLIDVLKQTLVEKVPDFRESRELVNDFIVKKTVGGPLRFRPPSREELENDLEVLDGKYKRAVDNLKKAKEENAKLVQDGQARKTPRRQQSDDDDDDTSTPTTRITPRPVQVTKEVLVTDPALQEEIDRLNVDLASKNLTIHAQADELHELHAEIDRLRVMEDKLENKKERISNLEDKVSRLQQENVRLVQERESVAEQAVQLREENQLLRDTRVGDVQNSDSERLRQLELIQSLRAREDELQQQLEEQQKKWAGDRTTVHQQMRLQEKEIQLLQDQLQQVQSEHSSLQKKHDRLFVDSEALKVQLNEARTEIQGLESRIHELDSAAVLRESLAREESDATLKDLMAKVKELETVIEAKDDLAKKLDRQLTASKLLARQAKKEKEQLQDRCSKLQEELQSRPKS